MPESVNSIASLTKVWLVGGASGVTLFLVLSGFLFCVISDAGKREINYKEFITNRVLRIFPLLTFFFFVILTASRQTSGPDDILRLITLQLNTGNPTTGWGHQFFPSGPIWTIAVEFQFYLIFPILALFLSRFGITQMIGMIAIAILTKLILVELKGVGVYYNLYHTIIGRIDQFLIGIILGYLYLNGTLTRILAGNIAKTACLVASLSCLTLFMVINSLKLRWFVPISFTVEAVLWGLVIYCYMSLNIRVNKKIDNAIAYLGGLSFSMYLLHLAVGRTIYKALELHIPTTASQSITYTLIFVLPASLLASVLTYSFIEKPFLSLKKSYTKPQDNLTPNSHSKRAA